jgi:AraC family transcriptional regulator, melibiose operon regulatory protein
MYFNLNLQALPVVKDLYKIERKTVWQQADSNHILVVILAGECYFYIDDVEYPVSRGDIFYIPQGQLYLRRPHGDTTCTFYYLHFRTKNPAESISGTEIRAKMATIRETIDQETIRDSYLPTYHSSEIYLTYKTSAGETGDEIVALLEKALTEIYRNDLESQLIIALYASHILALLTRLTLGRLLAESEIDLGEKIPPPLKKAMIFIRQNYTKKITLTQICSYCSVSPQHMIRLFRAILHVTPIQYVNRLKIAYSKELMRITSLSIKEIADELGFESPYYFSRLFKKVEGVYPTAFKERIRLSKAAEM